MENIVQRYSANTLWNCSRAEGILRTWNKSNKTYKYLVWQRVQARKRRRSITGSLKQRTLFQRRLAIKIKIVTKDKRAEMNKDPPAMNKPRGPICTKTMKRGRKTRARKKESWREKSYLFSLLGSFNIERSLALRHHSLQVSIHEHI